MGSVAHPECVAQPGVWGDPPREARGGELSHSRRHCSTGGFALSRTRRVRPANVSTLQIPAWFQLSGQLRRARERVGCGWRNRGRAGRVVLRCVSGGRRAMGDRGWWAVWCACCGVWGVTCWGRVPLRVAPADAAQLLDISLIERRDRHKPHTLGDRGLLVGLTLDADADGRARDRGTLAADRDAGKLRRVGVGGEDVHFLGWLGRDGDFCACSAPLGD